MTEIVVVSCRLVAGFGEFSDFIKIQPLLGALDVVPGLRDPRFASSAAQ